MLVATVRELCTSSLSVRWILPRSSSGLLAREGVTSHRAGWRIQLDANWVLCLHFYDSFERPFAERFDAMSIIMHDLCI